MIQSLLALSPLIVLGIGLMAVVVMMARPRTVVARYLTARNVARVSFAIALLATARLWIVDRGHPVDVIVVGSTTLETFVVPWSTILGGARIDVLALGGLTLALVMGIVELTAVLEPVEGPDRQALVATAGALLTGLLLCSADSISVTTLWFALSLLGIATIVASQKLATTRNADGSPATSTTTFVDLRGWLTIALIAAPALWLADSVLVSTNGGPSLLGGHPVPRGYPLALIFVGAATAALPPFDGWRDGIAKHREVAFIADGLAPIVGFVLAARGIGMIGARTEPLPLALLVLIGLWGLARLSRSSLRQPGFSIFARIDRSIAFILLVLPFPAATDLGLALVGLGALGRSLQRAPDRNQSRWLRWTIPLLPNLAATPEVTPEVTPASPSRTVRPDRRAPDLIQRVAILCADVLLTVEDRYDVAVGVLVALAVLFAFAG
jgi:hypothetical protein